MIQAAAAAPIKTRTTLVDITRCIGCRACQVACKQWNDRDGEQTALQPDLGFQNPAVLSAKTLTLISFHEIPDQNAPGGLQLVSTMWRCLHCLEPACVSSCPTTALARRPDGPVVYEESQCIGCRYCVWACPWGVPSADWDSRAPRIHKCTHCADRCDQPLPSSRNGLALTQSESQQFRSSIEVPACVKACPADALRYGDREEMLQEARKRIAARPDKYVDHIYGEKEAGGTSVLYLSAVPFEKLGFADVGTQSYPALSSKALHAVPPAVMAIGALLGGTYAFLKRRAAGLARIHAQARAAEHDHPEFAPLALKLWTPFNLVLAALMVFGALSLGFRFVFGLGDTTQLSDTYAWGLWIVFDLVWIAVAAGAFATAGLIYVFQRKDLYSMGRAAVLMGLLSYSFVTVTLVADLGLPWHFYQLALQAPEQSAMFEVSWCVGLYVTILLIEFLPVPFERWGLGRAMEIWQRWSGAYVAAAVTLFVYLLSRNLLYAAATAAIFSALAWAFRPKGGSAEPIMLAIAAVTLSTMHQSSLGSLFLLMPDKLATQWWSPVLPISFLLSSIAAGTGLVILIEMWMARAWRRPLRTAQLASMGAITFWSLLVYVGFRLGDMAVRGQLANAFSGRVGALFTAEILLGGVVPLLVLARRSARERPPVLGMAALLTTLGVVFNRVNVVLFAMTLYGPMPQISPETYAPTIVEWGISIGLIAATIFLFGLGARLMPVLPKNRTA
ncbi:MAG TPA: 4Fe-4S dicluster domain-containing protein [Vicinamibacterales bacterium]|nr:4Fe-4S dicluster domain-containing protein [Vicinamibacterales bacterium]